MAQTEVQVAALELERVLPQVPTLFDRDDTFYSQIDRRPAEVVSNRNMRIPLGLRPGGKSGHWDPKGGDLGRGSGPEYDKAVIDVVFLRHAVEFHTLAAWATDDRRKAVLNNFRTLLADSMAEFRRYADSLCQTAGDGVLGTISNVSTGAGVDTYTLASDGFGARLLRYGQDYNVYDSTLATCRVPAAAPTVEPSITYYDGPGKIIKGKEVTGAVATDKIVASGLGTPPPLSIYGVPYHHSDSSVGSWLGFTRSTTPEIRGNRATAGGSALQLHLPRLAMNKIGDRLGMAKMKRLQAWMHPCQVQAYEALGMLVTRINTPGTGGEGKGLDLYFGGAMQMAGAPVKKHFSWDKKRIDFVDLDIWGRAVMHEAGFYHPPGDPKTKLWVIRGASGGVAASTIFYLVAAFNLFVKNPVACAYIDALAVPTGY
jgi:hypothetical protein